ncbi:TonB-dependent receptor [Xanthomonas hyacinthi]|uniref:TonB-dependent receptor n=1 Tax=Xanthomonas hyacinthi TaxID=56455 RepID=A0A2S7EX65_9XANT|nr:TonB-dependent receptor [Xanthomonas hyacinthi DSM 19077]PPU97750.1 TonB-dependent receptor [Xanthomonas hyacinthi]QGY77055.1 TonB-dependent receptor [Xanthomonas hyacinthi]
MATLPASLYAQGADTAAAAATDGAVDLDRVTVTGSLVRRVDVETASPVTVVDRQQIQQSGKQTLGDLMQSLPGIAGDATNPQVNNGGGDGASTVSLRGLGAQRTLILIDGHRILNNDINSIPASMIDHVEILKVGASAVYGSDAIGGVVNYILRKNFEGGEFSANYGQASRGDGARRGGTFTFGKTWDRGNLVVGVDYNKQNAVSSADRAFSKDAMYLSSGSIYKGGSSRTPSGYYKLPGSTLTANGCSANGAMTSNGSGGYKCYSSASDAYNYQAQNLLMTPQQRVSSFVLGSFNVTDKVQAYVNAYHNHTMSHSAIAPLPFDAQSDGITIAADNPDNPFGVEFGPDGYEYRNRFTSLGQRESFYDTATDQDVLGLKGSFGDTSWVWDVNFNYGHYKQRSWSHGYVDYSALQEAIDGGQINIFDQQAASTWLNSHESIPRYSTTKINRQWEASANGSVWELPAGSAQLAVGALYRKESMGYTVSSNAVIDSDNTCAISSEACSSPLSGSFSVKEAYTQLFIPVLAQSSPIGALNVTLSDRFSDYSSVSSTNNSASFQLEWRPIHDLMVRGTVAQVFRAPTISDLYQGPTANSPTFTDPCIGYSGSGHDNACEGVETGWGGSGLSQTNAIVSGANYANYDLKPEKGRSYDYGIVYSPEFVQGLSFNLDWWKVKLNDLIQSISAQTVANSCYNDNSSPYCGYIHRYAAGTVSAGNIDYIETPVVNIGKLDTQGIDFGANYALPQTAFGKFTLALDSTYLQRYDIDTGDSVVHMAGKYNSSYGNYARWRARGQFGWKLGNWDASWTTRWVGKIQVGSGDLSQNMSADAVDKGVVLRYGSYMYHALQLGYDMADANIRFDLGVDNLFNKQPPVLYQNNVLNANTDVSTYDTVGRYYWMRASYRF